MTNCVPSGLERLTVDLYDVVDLNSALIFADMPKTSPDGHAWARWVGRSSIESGAGRERGVRLRG
jgi:hypothetical protein